ncbi:MAG: hypothetical protein IRZ00_20400 [Gemmatimonadetes bacterium]|nr:hypothetical protein [Gemmatimonadota bacterium]
MLTESALEERKWGPFPVLHKLLGSKRSSGRRYGFTSISDNVFEEIRRLSDIAELALENESDLLEAVRDDPELRERTAYELHHLRHRIVELTHAFDDDIRELERLWEEVHRGGRAD